MRRADPDPALERTGEAVLHPAAEGGRAVDRTSRVPTRTAVVRRWLAGPVPIGVRRGLGPLVGTDRGELSAQLLQPPPCHLGGFFLG